VTEGHREPLSGVAIPAGLLRRFAPRNDTLNELAISLAHLPFFTGQAAFACGLSFAFSRIVLSFRFSSRAHRES
jgi:hypothetical protein